MVGDLPYARLSRYACPDRIKSRYHTCDEELPRDEQLPSQAVVYMNVHLRDEELPNSLSSRFWGIATVMKNSRSYRLGMSLPNFDG